MATARRALGMVATVALCWSLFIGFVWWAYGDRFSGPGGKAAAVELEARKAAVAACVDARYRLVPGVLPSPVVKALIEADCAKSRGP